MNVYIVFCPESKEHRDELNVPCETKHEAHMIWLNQPKKFLYYNKEIHPSYKIRTNGNVREVFDIETGSVRLRCIKQY